MASEISRLRVALRDLVALSTIPAAWVGRDPPTIAAGLADVLVGALHVDFAFVRLRDPTTEVAVEATRGTGWPDFSEWLKHHPAPIGSRSQTIYDIEHEGNSSVVHRGLMIPIGADATGGLVTVASKRADFPTETDQLLLSVAAEEAATAFQSARLMSERRRAEAELRQARDELEMKVAQRTDELRRIGATLAHVTRVTTLGELAASIAHEINQPLAAIGANATASLNWLAKPKPNLALVREALTDIVADGHRAGDVIQRIRQLATKSEPEKTPLDLNDVIQEVVPLVRSEVKKHSVSLHVDLAPALPQAAGDRVQLQQVIINLVMNGVEAMTAVTGRPRELVIRTEAVDEDRVLVAVRDTGIGLDTKHVGQMFDAFFTTKPAGMGMGLSISRSIIEGHGGRLWATPNAMHGVTFQFALPATS